MRGLLVRRGVSLALPRGASAKGGNNEPFLSRCIADARRYLSSSSDSKVAASTKVGTNDEAERASALSSSSSDGKASHTVMAKDTLPLEASTKSREQSLVDRLTALYNENSGENELSLLKQHVTATSRQFDDAVRTVQTARLVLEKATATYDDVNKRHSALLMRRDQWDGDDATTFATLTAEEVQARKSLGAAREALRKAEDEVSSRQVDYIDAMRRRYHEEQIWQDRWRVLGTYGTWTLIGLNSLIFCGGQFFHYRREANRLKRIEDLIRESNGQKREQSIGQVNSSADTTSKMGEQEAVASVDQQEQDEEKDEATKPGSDVKNMTESAKDIGAAESANVVDDTVDDGETDVLVYNDITCPSDAESRDVMERLKRSRFAKRVRNVVVGIFDSKGDADGQEERNHTVVGMSRAISSRLEEVHWPSAAFGAIASTAGILLICAISGSKSGQ